METPFIITNFKVYRESILTNALKLSKIHEAISIKYKVNIGISVNPLDLKEICKEIKIPVFAQHVDDVVFGKGTGLIPPKAVKEIGAYGTLLNHSEKRLSLARLSKCIELCKLNNLVTIVCAENIDEGKYIMNNFGPNFIAIEPPELIGGDISVSKANPKIISNACSVIGKDRVIIGAGIKTKEDIEIALKIGATGILLASGITKSKTPYETLEKLTEGLKLL